MTEKIKTFKELAAADFAAGDFTNAFKNLWNEGVDEFVSYGQKVIREKDKANWFANKEAGRHFWEGFVLQESVFSQLLGCGLADQILHNYFSLYKVPAFEFERSVAHSFPDLFVKAVRVNQVFLNPDRIGFLTELAIGEPLEIHQTVWRFIQNTESSKWELIQAEFRNTKVRPIDEILCHCILWLETSRFQNDSNHHVHHLASIYGLFMEMLLRNLSYKDSKALNDERLMDKFLEMVVSIEQKKFMLEDSSVSRLMAHISDWLTFRDTVLSPYCYDLDIELRQDGELFQFNSTPESQYRWRLNGVRYELNRLRYLKKGLDCSEYLESELGMKVPGRTMKDVEANRQLDSEKWATMLLLDDLKHDSLKIGSQRIQADKLLIPLIAFSFNRRQRYELGLAKFFTTSKTWTEAFLKMTNYSLRVDIRNEPFFLMAEREYADMNTEALSELSENNTKELVQMFSFSPNEKYPFNRHNLQLNVWNKPFARLGTSLFCPMMFFANNDWFYSFAQVALSQKKDRKTTLEMEEYLSAEFAKRGW